MLQASAPSFLDHLNSHRRSAANMPAFYNHPRQLPLTPPDLYDTYAWAGKQPAQLQAMHPPYDQYQYNDGGYVGDSYYQASQADRRRYEEAYMRQMRTGQQVVPRENAYGPIAAPVLPPIRVPEQHQHQQHASHDMYRREAPVQETKQEKSAGGVAAQLDYEMETMVDFVAQMTSGMWAPFVARHDLSNVDFARVIQPAGITVDKKFRQYVQSVLTSTRLPSATLLLALHYLSDRIKRRSGRGDFPHRHSNNLYHHLTVALMLASKFLDDNTFQNRSWAEVSQLPVNELNAREMDWLHDICWHLHVDWEDNDGVRAWFAKWEEYQALRLAPVGDLSLAQLKLNPIDVNLRNLPLSAPISPPDSGIPRFSSGHSHNEHVRLPAPDELQWPQIRSLSPPSAGPTNANTPEYYGSANATPYYTPTRSSYNMHANGYQMDHRSYVNGSHGQLLYTRRSPYAPGYVVETRQRGTYTYDQHAFVGLDYTKQYATQLELGWCELHHRFGCVQCGYSMSMYGQAAAA